jgi:GT2 family glycosyltransferase
VKPRLSIVVPFFRVEAYIGDCLRSLARQTFDDFEVVLVDDGSPDDSAAIAREFVERDPRFRIVTQENQGLGPARNTGVKHCLGEFITFVDSDDLVPRHAYEMMVRTLDETGSSFAGGNVRRFNSSGVRESLLHRVPFARRRVATYVLEFPELALDRIVCNKVYRRCFWDEFGYEFPAMRYEDYPVSLRAHLDAVTVDCLPAAVYFWRLREAGDSITDQSDEYSNLVDRVASAEMVIDLVSRRAPELEPRVHPHLVRIDLLALLQAFRTAPASEEELFVALGQRLVKRLDAAALAPARRLDRLQIHALRTGDVAFLRELATFRHDGGLRGDTRARRRRLMPWQYESEYPGLTDRPRRAPRSMYRLRNDELALRTTVTDIRWHGPTVAVRGTAEIRHLRTGARSRLRVTLIGDGVEIPCEAIRFTTLDSHGDVGLVGFELRIGEDTFASLPETAKVVRLSVEVVNGRFRRRGMLGGLQPGSPVFAEGHWVREGLWVQPRQDLGGQAAFELLDTPARLTSVIARDGAFVLSGTLPAMFPDAHLIMTRASGGESLSVDLNLIEEGSEVRFMSRIFFADVVDAAGPDDTVIQRTTWVAQVADSDGRRILVPTCLDHAVGVTYDSRLLTLTRTPANVTSLHVSPMHFVADQAETSSTEARPRLRARGPLWEGQVPRAFVWRRFLDDSDDSVDVSCGASASSQRWSAAVDIDDLTTDRRVDKPAYRLATPTTWTLFAVAADGSSQAVRADEFLSSRLPIDVFHRGRTAKILLESGLLRVVVG